MATGIMPRRRWRRGMLPGLLALRSVILLRLSMLLIMLAESCGYWLDQFWQTLTPADSEVCNRYCKLVTCRPSALFFAVYVGAKGVCRGGRGIPV
jgi:hypothetical protein